MNRGDRMGPFEAKMSELVAGQISWSISTNLSLRKTTYDYASHVVYMLTAKLARLPQKGFLRISQPATWWDHLKQTLKHRYPRLCRRLTVRVVVRRYCAWDVLPKVEVPQVYLDQRFQIFWPEGATLEDEK